MPGKAPFSSLIHTNLFKFQSGGLYASLKNFIDLHADHLFLITLKKPNKP